ncbi:MAG: MmcQ/YjbR family DNA-binding protein [Solobacterium sp.]|nr:MmcQ/YjbR family DNA-binding protein [Solobacterium sp.]
MTTIEKEIFKRKRIRNELLAAYGFHEDGSGFVYAESMMDGSFTAEIRIDADGGISGKVIDAETGEEYTNYRTGNTAGSFSGKVREEYTGILEDIAEKCCTKEAFIFPQSNRIAEEIGRRYGVLPEFLWSRFPGYGVFRHEAGGKWFGIIMNIGKEKLIPDETGEIEVLNIKLDKQVPSYLRKEHIYPSWHLSKKSWVTVILDDSLSDEEILNLVDISYKNASAAGEWIIPANPKYYDVVNAFNDTDTILWKQSSNIHPGDIVYLYVAAPYSAVLFACEVTETDIPYTFRNKDLSMKKVMRIRLLHRYDKKLFTFAVLGRYGINAVRGPRRITKKLSSDLKAEYKEKEIKN